MEQNEMKMIDNNTEPMACCCFFIHTKFNGIYYNFLAQSLCLDTLKLFILFFHFN